MAPIATAFCFAAHPVQAPKFDGARAVEHVRELVAIGPRVAGTAGAAQARAYIRKQLSAIDVPVQEQPFEASTPKGVVKMVNLQATVRGRSGTAANTRIIIAGHYDTKRFDEFPFVGANDGGSSTAFLIEIARALKAGGSTLPIELVFLDGEEAVVDWEGTDHTYGSRHYVQAARRENRLASIGAMILVDMIGDRNLRILRETNSTSWLTDAIWSAAKRLGRSQFVGEESPVEDDHLEFLEAGVPSVDIIDLQYPDASMRYWHTREDTLDKVSADSLQAVGDVLIAALPEIERRIAEGRR